jgi:hypothetical protein
MGQEFFHVKTIPLHFTASNHLTLIGLQTLGAYQEDLKSQANWIDVRPFSSYTIQVTPAAETGSLNEPRTKTRIIEDTNVWTSNDENSGMVWSGLVCYALVIC